MSEIVNYIDIMQPSINLTLELNIYFSTSYKFKGQAGQLVKTVKTSVQYEKFYYKQIVIAFLLCNKNRQIRRAMT